MKQILKRFLSLALSVLMVCSLVPGLAVTAYAATSGTVTGLADENIGLSFTGSADNAWSASGTQIIGKARSTSGSGCGGGSNYRSTLTITNKKTTKATLSFDYTVVVSEGTILVNNTTTTKAGSFSQELAAGGTVEVEIESGSTSADTKITMTNVKLVADVSATVTFQPAENGSYTVDGRNITEVYTNTQSSMTAYKVEATPAEGYRFKDWYDVIGGKSISTDAKTSLNFDSDRTITARFVSKELALFETGGQIFDDLNDAIQEAQKKLPAVITLAENGKITGNYTIPSKVTLLIPFDEAKTCYTSTPIAITSASAATPFRTLTMAAGSSLTLANGAAISVGGQYYAASGGQQGRIVGPYGYIKMESGSAITVKSGANLYAWGFISGNGSVTVESGGSVYEWYQILDFRGGSASSEMGNKVFPFSQYAVQNVEVPLTLYAGASETVYTAVYAIRKINPTSIPFIGDKGMFKLVSGSLTKAYDGATDRIIYTIDGVAEVNSLNLKLAGASVSSSSYVLPLTNNMTINLTTGSKLTINQTAALLPGVETTIAKDAELVVSSGKSIYIYDVDEWGGYCGSSDVQYMSVVVAPGRTGKRAPLADVQVDVNGTLTAIGGIYTTANGADICSSEGTGVYNQHGNPGTETKTYQYTQKGSVTAHEIPITAAKLHNADGTYTETATASAGDIINYVNGVWGGEEPAELTVTFEANGSAEYPVEGTMAPQTVTAKTDTALNANSFTREGYNFLNWNTAADGTGDSYADGATVNLTEDTTLYAQWEIQKFTVTWVNDDGTELEKDENVEYGTTPEYNGETPTKAGDAQYTYTFSGWDPEISKVTANITYKAVYEQTVNTYTVIWKNEDGTILETAQVEYGTVPKYTGETPTKPADAQYTYAFEGWTPEITVVTEDAEYTATFTNTVRTYTVTWKNWDDTVLETDENVEYGATPEYNGGTPTKPADAQYTYTFTGWLPAVSAVTGDITYKAVFSEALNKYTITWKNGDIVLNTEQVDYGTTPVYSGETPVKDGDAQYSYTFTGWTPEITAVTGDAEYTAVFEQKVNTYTVTWKNWDGTELKKDENVKYGTTPEYSGEKPAREADAQYTYSFKGWTPEITAVTGNVEYTAVFEQTAMTYTITWVDENGAELEKDENVPYGTMPTYDGETPTKAPDEQYRYTFTGWSPEVVVAEEDATYTAQYSATARVFYTITFNANGGEGSMEPQHFEVGVDTALNTNTFTRENYKFTGWNTAADGSGATYADEGAILELSGDMTLYAQWQIWNGWLADATGRRYYKDGEPQKTGWTVIDGSTYYLDTETGYAAVGIVKLTPEGAAEEARCVFDAMGVFQKAVTGVYPVGEDTYWLNSGVIEEFPGLVRTENNGHIHYYYFGEDGKAVKNGDYKVEKNNGLPLPGYKYKFDENGIIEHDEDTSKNGICEGDGSKFYYIDGVKVGEGLIKVGDSYYYARTSSGEIVRGRTYHISKTNGYPIAPGMYSFDEDGKLLLNGFVEDGEFAYYYKDGVLAKGFVKIENDYYIFNAANGKMYKDATMWVGGNDYGIEGGMYYFGADGKMVLPDLENGVKKIVNKEDGNLYFTIDGAYMYNGLYELDGYYYYAKQNGTLAVTETTWVNNKNGLIPEKGNWYAFDAEGRLIQTGFVSGGDGYTYYYENNVLALGFTKISDDYYIFNTYSGKMYKNADMWVGDNAYGIEGGMYYFGADGKMVLPDLENGVKKIVNKEDGNLYFTVDGAYMYNGLYELDGDYYYAKPNGTLAVAETTWVSNKNGLIPEKGNWYAFDAEGRLIQTGFVTDKDGYTYYYEKNVLALGFTKIGDDYYIFNTYSGKMYRDAKMWVPNNDYGIAGGMYYFNADGKMAQN